MTLGLAGKLGSGLKKGVDISSKCAVAAPKGRWPDPD